MFSHLLRQRFYSTAANTGTLNNLQNILREDLKLAMRNKAPQSQRTMYRTLMSELKNLDIDQGPDSTPDEFAIWDHLNKLIKQRRSTAAEYMKPGQPDRFLDLAKVELEEANMIETYLTKLPVSSKEDITTKVRALIESEGIDLSDKKKLFKVIPWPKIQSEWKASRGLVSEVINEL